eukprot:CAMPEP_0182926802 /NCGR_PEP_ID=MMETSP0105_2-20130417/12271_1 /TAXON_ID=81532 ORGANISM="Acanthoeca-like sp., Strain 10tr" /NCGR_SAMPLE_ID=MMETSP0105_2 /ASSEMBLY_ACC=CAM_ASM_000205 /LENGTH=64 /DNA_ID=CAMNT_0025064711 /DNA_START=74 /DNA_END=268 /DNA_ORIENTATION=-
MTLLQVSCDFLGLADLFLQAIDLTFELALVFLQPVHHVCNGIGFWIPGSTGAQLVLALGEVKIH